jgi:molybdopterin/thiamine biosynthesis adenylyltransferase
MKKFTFRISKPHFNRLMSHLFPGDGDEHGAVIAAGICESERGIRLLAREVFLAKDGIDYVPGKYGYRALTANFVARVSDYCARERLCYFAVHCHGGSDSVDFSTTDLNSHARGYPALLDITNGGPVGALVFARNAVAGSIWTRSGVFSLENYTVIGANLQRLYPSRRSVPPALNPIYDRQARIFGAAGQALLAQTKVGIIGLGGAGSLISEWLAHLGVGEIVGVDFEKLEPTNQPRVVGSRPSDAQVFLSTSRLKPMQRLGRLLAKYKVAVARRTARRANPRVRYNAVAGNIVQRDVALLLKDVDFLFLCADSAQSRHVFNALVHQYLLPGIQVGSKVQVDKVSGLVGEIFTASRPVLPYANGGCLWCNELISPAKLQEEAISEGERRQQAYVEEVSVTAPSIITLNAVACAPAVNDFLLGHFGLLHEHARSGYVMQFSRDRDWRSVECRAEETCLHCGTKKASVFARGDRVDLPCR